ncbi:DsbA family protein [Pectobacterium cacticida]|uniref:DsbA family protein n=1 Tax=Pectobacterium cacticida TaxID=69221 RepID=UPI003987FFFB
MAQKRPSIPMQVQAFRHRGRPRWPWVLAAVLVALLLTWLVSQSSGESPTQSSAPVSMASVAGPPWQMGDVEGRFMLTLYADLECPFCRAYFPQIKQWVSNTADVALQWHHLPLAAHEPAASAEARLVECVAQASGNAAFWQAVEWVYANTRGDGQGLPDGLRYPDATPAIEQCLASERPDTFIRTQVEQAMRSGVIGTPSVLLHDRQTAQSILLKGPIEGDLLLSAMDMLAAGEADTTTDAPIPEMPADDVGDIPGSPQS